MEDLILTDSKTFRKKSSSRQLLGYRIDKRTVHLGFCSHTQKLTVCLLCSLSPDRR
jgi:hypothetical protein